MPPPLLARADEVIAIGWANVCYWHKADIAAPKANCQTILFGSNLKSPGSGETPLRPN
jgi:hypothetical protein